MSVDPDPIQMTGDEVRVSEIFAPFRLASPDQPFVVAQLGQSLDGRIATVTGHSRYINRASALNHLHGLRANVDAVIVGIGTVLADDPALTVRRVPGRSPARVIIDPSGKLHDSARCLEANGVRRYVVCGNGNRSFRGAETIAVDCVQGRFCPLTIITELHHRGLHRILVEGGSRTISSFMQAGAVDRLHVLVAPMIIGSGRVGIELPPIASLSDALQPACRIHLFADGDVLFDCDLRRGRQN
jgi:riboflavin-specific deaminase-like protein